MAIALFENGRVREAMTYEDYREDFEEMAGADSAEELPEEKRKYFRYYRLNFERSKRVEKSYTPSDRLRRAVQSIDEPQTWLVITEPWCGDSAQILPILARAAELNDRISFRIIHRDENLDIMDQYRTDGKRGIPKLIAFGEESRELFTWGPRPEPAQEIFESGEAEGQDRSETYKAMQQWYNDDGGATIDAELAATIEEAQDNTSAHNEQGIETMNEETTDQEKGREDREREEYERRVEEQIEEWEKKIDALKKQVEGLQSNLKQEVDRESKRYEKELDSLKVKRDAAKRLLSELTEAGGKAWSGFQKELGNALEGAGEGLQRLADRLREERDD
jgi:thiol-disulfide isomerase/thioredoxin